MSGLEKLSTNKVFEGELTKYKFKVCTKVKPIIDFALKFDLSACPSVRRPGGVGDKL
jgi:hypothetical protein